MATTREQIIETTCHLLEAQGYHATGLKQILDESHAPKGSLYYYFPAGKEELTEEAIEKNGKLIEARIRASMDTITEPAEAIRQFIHNLAGYVEASGYQKGGPITTVALETATTSERLSRACERAYQAWQDAFRDKLRQGDYSEEEATALANMIIVSIEGGIILCRTYKSRATLENVAQQVYRLLKR